MNQIFLEDIETECKHCGRTIKLKDIHTVLVIEDIVRICPHCGQVLEIIGKRL